jgi:beta-lactamase regulating signal transducer with metallopeptidase domain
MTPTLYSWAVFIGIFAAETALMVVLIAGICRFIRNAKRQRVCWQASLIAVTLISISELTGLRGRIPAWMPTQIAHRRLIVSLSDPRAGRDPVNRPLPPASANYPNSGTQDPVTWPGWLWISGTFTLLLVGGTTRAWLLAERRKMQPAGAEVWSIAKPLFGPLRLRKAKICTWRRVRGPVAFGFWRPTVALPLDFAERFTAQQREVMLAHELAHLTAHDPFWFALADVFCAAAWWHPFAWWMRRQFRRVCEEAADEASALISEGRTTLAESLVAFGRELSLSSVTGGLGVAGSGFRSELSLRVKALLDKPAVWQELPLSWRWGPPLFGIICAGMTAALPIQAANPRWMMGALAQSASAKTDATPSSADGTTDTGSIPATKNVPPIGNGHEAQSLAFLVQFIEVPVNNNPEQRGLDALFGRHPEEPKLDSGPAPDVFSDLKLPSQRNVTADRSKTEGQAAVLDGQSFTEVRRRLLAQGVDWLAAPRVKTLTGRRARVSINDVKTIVFDVETTDGTPAQPQASINYEAGDVHLGPTAEILTQAADKGCRFDVHAKFVEFLGYDNPGAVVPQARSWADSTSPRPEPLKATLPLPHFRVRQSQGSAVVKLGQTLALRGPLATETKKVKGHFFRSDRTLTTTNRFYVFVTLEPAQN